MRNSHRNTAAGNNAQVSPTSSQVMPVATRKTSRSGIPSLATNGFRLPFKPGVFLFSGRGYLRQLVLRESISNVVGIVGTGIYTISDVTQIPGQRLQALV